MGSEATRGHRQGPHPACSRPRGSPRRLTLTESSQNRQASHSGRLDLALGAEARDSRSSLLSLDVRANTQQLFRSSLRAQGLGLRKVPGCPLSDQQSFLKEGDGKNDTNSVYLCCDTQLGSRGTGAVTLDLKVSRPGVGHHLRPRTSSGVPIQQQDRWPRYFITGYKWN